MATDTPEIESSIPKSELKEPLGNPCGVVAIFIGKDGRVIANANDFNAAGYGGFALQQAQEIRARRSLAHEVLEKLSSSLICEAMDSHDAEKLMNSMCSRCGCRIEFINIGHST